MLSPVLSHTYSGIIGENVGTVKHYESVHTARDLGF